MANHNSYKTTLFVLLAFAVLYFAALGIYELKKWISKKIHKKDDE